MTQLRTTKQFTSWGRLESCIIGLNHFNKNEEFTGHINISSWRDFELSVHRPICAFCQKPFEINDKVEDHISTI